MGHSAVCQKDWQEGSDSVSEDRFRAIQSGTNKEEYFIKDTRDTLEIGKGFEVVVRAGKLTEKLADVLLDEIDWYFYEEDEDSDDDDDEEDETEENLPPLEPRTEISEELRDSPAKLEKEKPEQYQFWKERVTGCCERCELLIAEHLGRDDSAADDMECADTSCPCVAADKACTHAYLGDKLEDEGDLLCLGLSKEEREEWAL